MVPATPNRSGYGAVKVASSISALFSRDPSPDRSFGERGREHQLPTLSRVRCVTRFTLPRTLSMRTS